MNDRYSRQSLLPWIGPEGQREIAALTIGRRRLIPIEEIEKLENESFA